jgi:membrane protease YdiL (CAAX protease family)
MRHHDLATSARVQLAGMVALSLATFGAFWAGLGLSEAWPALAIMLGFTAIVHAGRTRSATVEVMSGIGDERTTVLYQRAATMTTSVLALALPAWWLGTVVAGEPNETLSLVGALFAVAFIGSCVVAARRG